jgi:hypothetical protein
VRKPLRELNKDEARALETTIRTLQTSVRQIERTAGETGTTNREAENVRTAHA